MEKLTLKSKKLLYYSGLLIVICLCFFTLKFLNLYDSIINILKAIIPVALAIIVSFLVEPLIIKLTRFKIKRIISVLLVYIFIYGFIVLLLTIIIPIIFNNLSKFIKQLPTFINQIENCLSKWLGLKNIDININSFTPKIDDKQINNAMSFISNAFDIGFDISLVIVGSIFLSIDFLGFKNGVKSFLPKKYKNHIESFLKEFLPFIYKYVKGIFIDSIFIFVIGFISFLIFGFDDFLFFSLLLAITNVIPIFGAYISGIPIVLISLLNSTKMGITALIIIVVLQVIDGNIIQPIIMKNVLYLHPLENILGISILTTLFGLVGMIISPVLVTAIKILKKHIIESKKAQIIQLE